MDDFCFDRETRRFAITGHLTVYQVDYAQEALRAAYDSGLLREIDLSGVTKLDAAGLQLLMLAKRIRFTGQKPVRLVNLSQPVMEALAEGLPKEGTRERS